MEIKTLTNYLQSANINFLIGSGASRPFLGTLGKIEEWLTQFSSDNSLDDNQKKLFLASVYRAYYQKAIIGNYTKTPADKYIEAKKTYANLLSTLNEIVNKRGSRLISKQVNLLTTNIDTLIENAAEGLAIEFNDGFRGSINQVFDESNFRKSISKASLHFQSVAELPVFNLYKMHGSINWSALANGKVGNDYQLSLVSSILEELRKIKDTDFVETEYDDSGTLKPYEFDDLVNKVKNKSADIMDFSQFDPFLNSYEKFIMVNPTKHKFQETVMDMHFYELMRLYSNSLEKENSILFVIGFSFADEHIAKLTMRAADSNPTLQIVVFAYSDSEVDSFKKNLNLSGSSLNSNVTILTPSIVKRVNKEFTDTLNTISNFSLESVNIVFNIIRSSIPNRYGK